MRLYLYVFHHHVQGFYIFHYKKEFSQGGTQPGVVISGSSNLTYSGLKGQGEHNRILREIHYYEEDYGPYAIPPQRIISSIQFGNPKKKKLFVPYTSYQRSESF